MAQTFHRYRAGDRPVGGYRLIRKLGEGGFGEVWQAAAPGGAEVALKFIDLTGQQGFREFKSLRLVKKITHNNLTPLHGFWLKNEDGTLIDESDVTWSQIAPVAPNDPSVSSALATAVFTHPVELIVAMGLGKKSLYDRLRECKDEGLGGIPADELLDYMEDAAKGIDYLNRPIHDMGHGPVPIVHSDVKPHNILIVGDGSQVCDFGLAHAVEALRKTCAAPLTLAYAAPESFRGKPSDKSDQYSLAITYVELRTGSLPFDEALTGYEVMTAHVQGQLDFTRLIPAEESVIRKATAPLPQDRWRNCREMVIELRRALRLSTDSNFMADAGTVTDSPTRLSGPPPTPSRAQTMMPPGTVASETTGYSGLTPTEPTSALTTKTSAKVTPTVVDTRGATVTARRRKVSTGAKLLVSLLLLAGIGAAAAYEFFGPGTGWFAKKELSPEPATVPDPSTVPDLPPVNNKDDRIAFDQLVERRQYADALKRLVGPTFPPAEIAQERADVLGEWSVHAKGLFHRAEFQKAARDYEQLVENYSDLPEVNELKLMQVRARMGFDVNGAGQVFGSVQPPATPDSPVSRIYSLVKLLIESNKGMQPISIGDLHAAWQTHSKQTNPNSSAHDDLWLAIASERKQLENVSAKIIGNWLSAAEMQPASKETLDDLAKIVEIDPKNVDAWIAKADAHWELNEPSLVTAAMAEQAKLGGSPRVSWIGRRAIALESFAKLTDPNAEIKTLDAALRDLPRVMANVSERRQLLAAAAIGVGQRDVRKYSSPVVVALRSDAEAEPKGGNLRRQFIELLKSEIPQRLAREENFAAVAEQLKHDCELIAFEGGADVPEVIRACHAECLLQLRLGDPKQALGAPGSLQYSHYVRARVYADRFGGDPKEVEASLKQLFKSDKPAAVLLNAGRSQKAIELLNQIADQVRPFAGSLKVETLLRQPVAATPAARETYEVLKNAYRWTNPPTLAPKSLANLAIAAWWLKTSPQDEALAQSISKDVASAWLKEGAISLDDRPLAFSLYYTLLAAHAGSKDEAIERLRVDAAQKLIQLASATTLDAKDAAAFNSVVLAQIEPLASRQGRHEFFADAARLIAKNSNLNWGFAPVDNRPVSTSDKLDDLYSEAIKASGRKVGEYFKARADLRALRQPPDHVGLLADAGELKNFKNYVGQGSALEGYVHFLQSREQQGSVAKRYEKLQLALKSLVEAEKYSTTLSKADQDQVSYFRSLIHTERGNLAELADTTEKVIPREEFKKAIQYAEKVINSGGGPNLQFAYEAAANAYEDLAWHARVEPEINFNKALDHLTNSVAFNRDSPTAHMALARSYYKMIVEAGVNRKVSRESLEKAKAELREAITLAGDGKNAEAHLWLGKVIQATHVDEQTSLEAAQKLLTAAEYRQADDEFTKAFRAAEEGNYGPVFLATYAYTRAEHALFNPTINTASVHSRADQLAKLKQGRTVRMDPVQEARILRATADLIASSDPMTPVKALEHLDDASLAVRKLADDELTRSDVKLIEFRLALQDKLRPHQLASPAIVQSAVQDAVWYSKVNRSLAWKDRSQSLLTALKLSQQMAIKNPAYVQAAASDQSTTLQRIIDVKFPSQYDFKRHLEIVNICITALKEANSPAMVNVHQKLRQVTRTYLQDVLNEAKRLKRPTTETAALDKFLAAVPP